MRARFLLLLSSLLVVSAVHSQDLPAYLIFNGEGKEIKFDQMVRALSKADVVFFGELHNNPISHWLQYEVTNALHSQNEVVLGAEWFELDDQIVIDEYLNGDATAKHIERETKIWPNYKTDYRPILEFAKQHGLSFIATNVPRRYASLVSKSGPSALDSLSTDSKMWLPKLPYSVMENDKGYEEMKSMMGGHGHGMNMDYLVAAQALKDYTMASRIVENRKPSELFIHFNGNYHSKFHDGIVNYLADMDSNLSISVIASVEADKVQWNEEWEGMGDFIIVTPSTMTKTH